MPAYLLLITVPNQVSQSLFLYKIQLHFFLLLPQFFFELLLVIKHARDQHFFKLAVVKKRKISSSSEGLAELRKRTNCGSSLYNLLPFLLLLLFFSFFCLAARVVKCTKTHLNKFLSWTVYCGKSFFEHCFINVKRCVYVFGNPACSDHVLDISSSSSSSPLPASLPSFLPSTRLF